MEPEESGTFPRLGSKIAYEGRVVPKSVRIKVCCRTGHNEMASVQRHVTTGAA